MRKLILFVILLMVVATYLIIESQIPFLDDTMKLFLWLGFFLSWFIILIYSFK